MFAFERNEVVRAGAGTGKTEALATLYLHLVGGLGSPEVWPRGGVPPERVAAMTFTEKAAREMRERIAEAVDLLAAERLPKTFEDADEARRQAEIARWVDLRRLPRPVAARIEALADSAARSGRPLPPPEVWQRIAWSLGSTQIGTFHGFAAGVLRRAAVDLGLDPAFEVLEQPESDRMLRAASLRALASAASRDLAWVVELMGACGGLGERAERGLVSVVAGLVRALEEDGVKADGLRLRPAVEPSGALVSAAADTLRRFAGACDKAPSLRDDGTAGRVRELADAAASLPALDAPERALERLQTLRGFTGVLPPRGRTKRLEPLAEEAREALQALETDALAAVSVRLGECVRAVVAEAQRGYEALRRRRAGLDYADLMRLLRDGMRDRPAFRREWKHRYDAVLVDEFQDTNQVQRDLLFLLRERRDAERVIPPGGHPSAQDLEPSGLFLVGDAKQSIYAFRFAEVAVFLATERELVAAGGEALELTDSFRALEGVLAAVNPVSEALLGTGMLRPEGMYDRARDALVSVAPGDGQPRVELLLVPEGRADPQRQAEAEAIAARIAALALWSVEPPAGWRPPRMDEVAILVPSWSHLEPLKRALQTRRIPYVVRGGPGFWDRREVDDLVVLLRWVSDPSDRLSLAALLRGPLVGLSDAGLGNLFARSSGLEHILDPPAALRAALDPEDRARLDEARPSLWRLVRFGSTLGPDGVLRQCLAERNYCAVLARLPFGAQRVANVDKLVGMATAAARRGGEDSDLAGFVAWLDRTREASQRESEADLDDAATGSVQLLSIHAAKGLEWPVVFVAQTSRRAVPRADRVLLDAGRQLVVLPGAVELPETFRALRREAYAAEEDDGRRLLYVALTRARDLLVVSGPSEGGEGPWVTLRSALQREAPHRVRVLIPAQEAPPGVPVRAHREGQDAPEASLESEAPTVSARRRLHLAGGALQDYALCPRRYHALYELRLTERGVLGAEQDAAGALARRALHEAPLGALFRDPGEALEGVCRALGEECLPAVRQAARGLLERFVDSAPGVCLQRTPEALLGRALPFSVKVSEGPREVLLTGRVDLVLRGEGLGRDGVVALRYAMPPERDDRWEAMPEGELGLELARLALHARYREAPGEAVTVHAAVLALASPGSLEWVLRREPLEGRALDLAEALAQSHAAARWDGRPRYVCEGLRCGFIPRCHG